MRHSISIKTQVRVLREGGLSLDQIHKQTNVPETTIRSWISDIVLSKNQLEILKNRTQIGLQRGRIKMQEARKKERVTLQKKLFEKGKNEIGTLTDRELFLAGVALYWGEGFKNVHERCLGFCNSDPNMIRFYLHWLTHCFGVEKENLIARLTLNITYQKRAKEIELYWSDVTGIPLNQFSKPFYQNSQWKRQYNTDNYKGVLRIYAKKSLDYFLTMKGWIEGLKNMPG